ncbi:hypothetical protein ACFY3U_07450 [Micromonospora sp. NPDC000089]|uniref:hypothetical protein n=1 Tax=unclassified Micromonospora TaxID=2617518 RepID=UPI003680BBDB
MRRGRVASAFVLTGLLGSLVTLPAAAPAAPIDTTATSGTINHVASVGATALAFGSDLVVAGRTVENPVNRRYAYTFGGGGSTPSWTSDWQEIPGGFLGCTPKPGVAGDLFQAYVVVTDDCGNSAGRLWMQVGRWDWNTPFFNNGWVQIPMNFEAFSPRVMLSKAGKLYVVVTAEDGKVLWQNLNTLTGVWSGWTELSTPSMSPDSATPAIVEFKGAPAFAVVGSDRKVYVGSFVGRENPSWKALEGLVAFGSTPALAVTGDNTLAVFALTDELSPKMYYQAANAPQSLYSAQWRTSFKQVPGQGVFSDLFSEGPTAVTVPGGEVHLYQTSWIQSSALTQQLRTLSVERISATDPDLKFSNGYQGWQTVPGVTG